MAYLKRAATLGLTLATVVSAIPMTSLAAHYDEWVKKDGKWYYYDSYGRKLKYDSEYDAKTDSYYVLNGKGQRVTDKKGWYKTKYIITYYGDKVECVNWYYLKKGGACTKGWKKIGGKYYYFYGNGKMAMAESFKTDGKYYLVDADGVRVTKKGWHTVKYSKVNSYYGDKETVKNTYYVNSKGTVSTGAKTIGGKKYYFGDDGIMRKSTFRNLDNGDIVVYGKDGAQITKKGLVKITSTKTSYDRYSVEKTKIIDLYYIQKDGTAAKGWKKIDGKMYYFNRTWANALRAATMKSDDKTKTYIFNKDGVCVNY